MKNIKFSLKNKFLVVTMAICFLISTLFSGCSFLEYLANEDALPETSTPKLNIITDDLLVYSEENSRYEITLYAGATYTLNLNLGDYTGNEYSVVYSWNSSGNNYASIENKVITINSNAPTYLHPQLTIKLQKNGSSSAIETKKIYITITERALVSLLTNSNDVKIKKSNQYGVDYEIKVPLAYRFYQMPTVIVDGYDKYEVFYQRSEDEFSSDMIEFKLDDDKTYFRLLDEFDFLYPIKFYILVKDENGVLIKQLTCEAVETLESDEVIEVYYGNEMTKIANNETIYIEKNDTNVVPLKFFFNGTEVLTYQSCYELENSNSDIEVKTGSTIFGYDWRIKSLGKVADTVITYTYKWDTPSAEENITEYVFKLNVSVIDTKTLEDLVVPLGADAFSIVDNNVFVNGKIYAIYSVGNPEAINGKDNLSIQVANTANANVKRVTLSYKYKDVTKEVYFDVEINKTAGFTKTQITQNYQKYWQKNGYVTTAYKGEVKVLAIPIWFTDSNEFISTDDTIKDSNNKTQREQIIEDLNTALFGENEDLTFRSLRTYYLEESLGRLKISGKVTPWYESNTKSTDYSDKDPAITTLTVDAVKWYFDQSGTNETRADYDANNDGKIDHIMVFYGSNYHCFRNGLSVASGWCRKVGDTTDSYISRSSFSWISALDPYGINGVSPNVYSQLTKNDLSTIHGIKAKTIIHEFAHAIGILDIYDTSMKNEPAGGFSMQSGKTGGHDPYNMMAMGWANPYVFDSSDTTLSNEISITINDFQSSGDVILLTPHWNSENQIFDEYILLELFTATGLNQYDANAGNIHNLIGIRLWHVNATIDSSTNRHYNSNNSLESNYNLVHFIRNDVECEYRSLTALDKQEYLFGEGDIFDMQTYKSQFYNADGKLDNGNSLGWSFEVINITPNSYGKATATIKLIKTA